MFAVLFVVLALPGSFAEDKLFVNPGNELFQYFVPLFEYYDRENFNHYYDTKFRRDKANEYVRIVGTVVPPKTDITFPCDWVDIYSAENSEYKNTWIYPSYMDLKMNVTGDTHVARSVDIRARSCGAKRKLVFRIYRPYANETKFHEDAYIDNFTTRPARPLTVDIPFLYTSRDYTHVW